MVGSSRSVNISLGSEAVRFDKVCFSRGSSMIYSNLNLSIPANKIVGVLGPSGTGKTTLLHLISGLLKPDSGNIEVKGELVNKLSTKDLYAMRRKMGMLFQSGALFTDLSVFENVAFPIRQNTTLPDKLIQDIVFMKLESVGLRGAKDLYPHQLSGGMTRRVALARAIALDPSLIMYDEPFTGQDPITLAVLLRLIKTLNKALQMTTIVVTHDIQEVMSIADHIIILSKGQVIAQGSPEQIRSSTDKMVVQFIHGKPDGPVPFHYPSDSIAKDLIDIGGV